MIFQSSPDPRPILTESSRKLRLILTLSSPNHRLVSPNPQLVLTCIILTKSSPNLVVDHDDASSWFEDSLNVMVYGSHKWRDGVHKHYFENLYVIPEDSGDNAQWGIGWYCLNTNSSRFVNNTMVSYASGQFHYVWYPFPTP